MSSICFLLSPSWLLSSYSGKKMVHEKTHFKIFGFTHLNTLRMCSIREQRGLARGRILTFMLWSACIFFRYFHFWQKCCHFYWEMTIFLPDMKISEKYVSGPYLERTLFYFFFQMSLLWLGRSCVDKNKAHFQKFFGTILTLPTWLDRRINHGPLQKLTVVIR